MLVELSMVEQRYQAVREVLDSGATITEVAGFSEIRTESLEQLIDRFRVELNDDNYGGDTEYKDS
jgi:hypothetical protein